MLCAFPWSVGTWPSPKRENVRTGEEWGTALWQRDRCLWLWVGGDTHWAVMLAPPHTCTMAPVAALVLWPQWQLLSLTCSHLPPSPAQLTHSPPTTRTQGDEDQQDLATETDLDHSQHVPSPTGPLDLGPGRPEHGHRDYPVHLCLPSILSGTGVTLQVHPHTQWTKTQIPFLSLKKKVHDIITDSWTPNSKLLQRDLEKIPCLSLHCATQYNLQFILSTRCYKTLRCGIIQTFLGWCNRHAEVEGEWERVAMCSALTTQRCFLAYISTREAHRSDENALIKSSGQEDTDQCCSNIVAVA